MFGLGAKKEVLTLKVQGMMCVHCKKRVEDAVKAVKGVSKVNADVENALVTVEYDCKKTEKEEIVKAITDAEYVVTEA